MPDFPALWVVSLTTERMHDPRMISHKDSKTPRKIEEVWENRGGSEEAMFYRSSAFTELFVLARRSPKRRTMYLWNAARAGSSFSIFYIDSIPRRYTVDGSLVITEADAGSPRYIPISPTIVPGPILRRRTIFPAGGFELYCAQPLLDKVQRTRWI